MITTDQYLITKDPLDPLVFQWSEYDEIIEEVHPAKGDMHIDRTSWINNEGKICKRTFIGSNWRAYAPGTKPPKPEPDIMEEISYDDKGRVERITQKSLGSGEEIGGSTYDYQNNRLVSIRHQQLRNRIIVNEQVRYEYDDLLRKVYKSVFYEGQKRSEEEEVFEYKEGKLNTRKKTTVFNPEGDSDYTEEYSTFHYDSSESLTLIKAFKNEKLETLIRSTAFTYDKDQTDLLKKIVIKGANELTETIEFVQYESNVICKSVLKYQGDMVYTKIFRGFKKSGQ